MPRWKRASSSSSDSAMSMSGPSLLPSSSSSASSASSGNNDPVCSVCNIPTNSTNLNYGALTCLSCRAFFRRIIQQKLKQELKCRGSPAGSCAVTPENRKKCKRCRFEQCLKMGMRPDAVLNESQYQRRFRKMISKQQQTLIDNQVIL